MATARKKQDEKHLKILRELVALPANKQCFDCHQRGPTYVNMTIGSFVCTSCSGLLRGLTPPHRVKSISMASFSPEEVELIKARGNEYCKQIWLGLYDATHSQDSKDEQQIKDFMIAKYERKRYYVDPTTLVKNGPAGFSSPEVQARSRTSTPSSLTGSSESKPSSTSSQSKTLALSVPNSTTSHDNMFTPDKPEFLADFGSADPFSSSQLMSSTTQQSFANFENNPAFNSSNDQMFGTIMKSDSVPSKYNTNRWSMPTATTLSTLGTSVGFPSPARKSASSMGVNQPLLSASQPPSEDRYAALKDLDSLMKSQQQQQQQQQQASEQPPLTEWSTVPATTAWPVSTGNGSVFSQPQSGFVNPASCSAGGLGFAESTASVPNPFAGGNVDPWAPSSGANGMVTGISQPNYNANPFRTNKRVQPPFGPSDTGCGWGAIGVDNVPNGGILSGMGNVFPTSQSMNFPAKAFHVNSVGNPFVLGASPAPTGHSSNPFL